MLIRYSEFKDVYAWDPKMENRITGVGIIRDLQPSFKLGERFVSMSQAFVDAASCIKGHATWEDTFVPNIAKQYCSLYYLFWDVQFGFAMLNETCPS